MLNEGLITFEDWLVLFERGLMVSIEDMNESGNKC